MATGKGFAAALASAKPLTKTIRLCLDGELLAQAETLSAQLLQAKLDDEDSNTPDQAPELKEQLEALAARIRDSEVEFTFRSLGRLAWHDLIAKHPPEKAQREAGADFNVQTFPPAAMAAACVTPEGADLDGFTELAAVLTDGQWNRLWITCHAANTTSGDVPNLAAASERARLTETS